MSALDVAVLRWPELDGLRHLDGWKWQRGDEQGDLADVGLCGYQQIAPAWMNVIWIFGPDDAHGVRAMIDGAPTWEEEGSVAEVLTALAKLPRPGQPGAPLTAIMIGQPTAPASE